MNTNRYNLVDNFLYYPQINCIGVDFLSTHVNKSEFSISYTAIQSTSFTTFSFLKITSVKNIFIHTIHKAYYYYYQFIKNINNNNKEGIIWN